MSRLTPCDAAAAALAPRCANTSPATTRCRLLPCCAVMVSCLITVNLYGYGSPLLNAVTVIPPAPSAAEVEQDRAAVRELLDTWGKG